MDYVRGRVFKNIRLPDIPDAGTRAAIYDQMNQFVHSDSFFFSTAHQAISCMSNVLVHRVCIFMQSSSQHP